MRKAWLLLLLAPSALVWACGGGDNVDLDGGSDAQGDNTTKNDSGGDGGSKDGVASDTSTDTSSNDVANEGGFNIACRAPSDCIEGGIPDGSYPPAEAGVVCCGTLVLSGQPPNCNFDSLTTVCQTPGTCASNIALQCTTDTIRGCEHTSECTETNYNHCCHTNGFGDGGASVCMSTQIAQLIGAQCFN
jgi:hypothetical protein